MYPQARLDSKQWPLILATSEHPQGVGRNFVRLVFFLKEPKKISLSEKFSFRKLPFATEKLEW